MGRPEIHTGDILQTPSPVLTAPAGMGASASTRLDGGGTRTAASPATAPMRAATVYWPLLAAAPLPPPPLLAAHACSSSSETSANRIVETESSDPGRRGCDADGDADTTGRRPSSEISSCVNKPWRSAATATHPRQYAAAPRTRPSPSLPLTETGESPRLQLSPPTPEWVPMRSRIVPMTPLSSEAGICW
ncbi:hypothetical protein Vafri_16358 [Volvox africanus]|uniref:Uncharacterized protein n=1 Tax=Volvox africanus TaxID=51714 RepID=A0A8J4BI73_9CHLO|nr:hypothetical protein Vafri_16358 [Volvox africanus]